MHAVRGVHWPGATGWVTAVAVVVHGLRPSGPGLGRLPMRQSHWMVGRANGELHPGKHTAYGLRGPVPGPSGAVALARAIELHGSAAMVIAGAAPKVSLGVAAKVMHGMAHGVAAKVMHGMAAKVPIGVANGMAAMCGMAAMRGIPAAGGQGVRRQEQCTLGRWRLSRLRGSRWHRRGSRWRRGKGIGSWGGCFARSASKLQSATP